MAYCLTKTEPYMDQSTHQSLHAVEEHIIQLKSLIETLDLIENDDCKHMGVLQPMNDRFEVLETEFYALWQHIAEASL